MKYVSRTAFVTILGVMMLLATPVQPVLAVSESYEPQSIEEMIAYLYGMISQLQAQLDAREGTDGSTNRPRPSAYDIDVDTRSPSRVTDDSALLRGRVDLDDAAYVRVWFEYGETTRLGERTSVRRLADDDGESQSFSRRVDDLDDDERYYYRAVAEAPGGERFYGALDSFTTEDSSRWWDDDDDWRDDDDDDDDVSGAIVRVSDATVDQGDTIEVDWVVPTRYQSSTNWIGLYERGASDQSYRTYVYTTDDTRGTVTFRLSQRGEYEFRLFYNNGYDQLAESRRVTVE